jgi:hypothetical protein
LWVKIDSDNISIKSWNMSKLHVCWCCLTLILLMWRIWWAPNIIPIYIQQDATLHRLFISGNCSTCFGWYFHPSSGAHTTVSTAYVICRTVTAICRYRGRVGTSLSVLWVANASHSTLKPVPNMLSDTKRQVINLRNCCNWLVNLFELYDDARTGQRQINFCIYKRPDHLPILSQVNPVFATPSKLLKIHCNIILPSTLSSYK